MFDMRGVGYLLLLIMILGIGGIVFAAVLGIWALVSGSISFWGVVSLIVTLSISIPCLRYMANFRLYR